jgi:hypothetical protein
MPSPAPESAHRADEQTESVWRTMDSAPKDGTPILLYLDPPIEDSEVQGWLPMRHLYVVVGWADGLK